MTPLCDNGETASHGNELSKGELRTRKLSHCIRVPDLKLAFQVPDLHGFLWHRKHIAYNGMM